MIVTEEQRDQLLERFGDASRRLIAMLRSIPVRSASLQVEGLDWTVADTAAHLASVFRRMTGDARRAFDVGHLVELNDKGIAEVEGGLPEIAAEIEARIDAIETRMPHVPLDRLYPFHFGLQVSATTGLAVVMGEVLVHGWEIARTAGVPFEIEPIDVAAFYAIGLETLAGYLTAEAAGVSESWRIEMPGTKPVTISISDGRANVGDGDGVEPSHVVVVDDPVTFMLGFPYGRVELPPPADVLASRFDLV